MVDVEKKKNAVNSAALQDHIMSSYNLTNLDPFSKKTTSYGVAKKKFKSKYKKPGQYIKGRQGS